MKIMIEVSGGVVTNIVSTGECEIYLIDHDNLKERGGDVKACMEPLRPGEYWNTHEGGHVATPGGSEFPEFDGALQEALEEYTEGDKVIQHVNKMFNEIFGENNYEMPRV